VAPEELQDIQSILNDPRNILEANKAKTQRDYSAQITNDRLFTAESKTLCRNQSGR